MRYFSTHEGAVAALILQHIALSGGALAIALLVAIPLALLAQRSRALSTWLVGALGALYTIPSLALLAVLVSLLGLGPAPLIVALVLYAQFMLVRSFITALRGVDASALDAADGLGFSPAQRFRRVQVPLAMPVAVGGVRVAAVASIAIATLGGYIGAGGLGTLIFNGLTLHHDDMILTGAVSSCALAVAVDAALRAAERLARNATL